MKAELFGFLFGMWVLILIGGGIIVVFLGPLYILGYENNMNWFLTSSLKAVIAIVLVVTWVIILSKLKNWIFKKELQS